MAEEQKMDKRKLLFVQLGQEVKSDVTQRLTDRLNELSSEYQFVVFGPSVNLLTPGAACYSLTETIDSYSYTITAKTPTELLDLRNAIREQKKSKPEEPKRGREFI